MSGVVPEIERGPMRRIFQVDLPEEGGSGRKLVTVAGTREVLAATQILYGGVQIRALSTNTGYITVYLSPTDTYGMRIEREDGILFIEINDLAVVYVDASVNGEGVEFIWT